MKYSLRSLPVTNAKRPSRKRTPKEGSIFAVPLRDGGFARGVVARSSGKGINFGYFFGPKLLDLTSVGDEDFRSDKAILIGLFGDLGLINGEWPVLGRIEAWSRVFWPMPSFKTMYKEHGFLQIVDLDQDSLNAIHVRYVAEANVDVASVLPEVMMGYGAVEIRLTRLLS